MLASPPSASVDAMQTSASIGSPGVTRNDSRFLHIIPDDKFIDAAHAIFEEVDPGSHDFLVVDRRTLHHIRSFQPIQLDLVDAIRPEFLEQLPGYAAVVVHYLSKAARLIVDAAPAPTNFAWIGWGADYYHLIKDRGGLLLPKTRALVDELRRSQARSLASIVGEAVEALHHPWQAARNVSAKRRLARLGPGAPDEHRLLDRISIFAPVLPEDYEAIQRSHTRFSPLQVRWNYWTEGFGATSDSTTASSRDILLGNSATHENNHLDALGLLAQAPLDDRRIICPLSYGDQAYGDEISARGRDIFGSQFVPVRHFIDSGAYARMLQSCSIAAMNHVRQQAMGNIILMLWQGSRVFLNPASPVRAAMARIGIETYEIGELPNYLRSGGCAVDQSTLQDVRSRLAQHFGRSAIIRQTERLLSLLRQARNERAGSTAAGGR